MKHVANCSVALALAWGAVGCGGDGAVDYKRSCPAGDESEFCAVFDLVNRHRASAGVEPYEWNAALAAAGQAHCEDMLANDYFSHDGLNGSSFADRAQAAGYEGMPRGENIASGAQSAEAVMEMWMDSEGHRANILSEGSNEIGVGFCGGSLWVQVFGFSPSS